MSIQILGADGATTAAVDAGFNAQRSSIRPMPSLAWISVGAASGSITGIAAGGAIFSFRNASANLIAIRRIGVGFITTTAFTAAQRIEMALQVARAFTVSDSGGTTIALTGSNGKHRSSMGVLTSVDARISTTAALTAGTKTLDTNYLAIIGAWSGAAGAGINPAVNNLFGHDPEDYPLILAQNEGFNIINAVAMGAAGVGNAYVNIEAAEVSSF